MTDSEREALRRHEQWISQPVRVLFPPQGPRVQAVCRQCGNTYERAASAGKSRGFCGERCREAWRVGRKRVLGETRPRFPQSLRRSA